MASHEEVVVFDAPTHLAYELRKGMPVVGYRADVTLEPDGSGTTILWASSFDHAKPAFTSGFFKVFFKGFVRDTAKRLARAAEQGDTQ